VEEIVSSSKNLRSFDPNILIISMIYVRILIKIRMCTRTFTFYRKSSLNIIKNLQLKLSL